MKKVIIAMIVFVLALAFTLPIYADPGNAAPKATGGVGYTDGTLEQRIEFNAFQLSECSSSGWSVVGSWSYTAYVGSFPIGTAYTHDANISSQTGGVLVGTGGSPAGGPYTKTWSLTEGTEDSTISGNDVQLVVNYDSSSYQAIDIGIIQPDGSIIGTWTDSSNNSGIWISDIGSATKVLSGCEGKGMLRYSDANGDWYKVDVQYVNVDGDEAYLAGPVTKSTQSSWIGNWVFCKVKDGGEPGSDADQVWVDFTDEDTAILGVCTMTDPGGPYTVTSGNLQVH